MLSLELCNMIPPLFITEQKPSIDNIQILLFEFYTINKYYNNYLTKSTMHKNSYFINTRGIAMAPSFAIQPLERDRLFHEWD